MGSRVMSYRLFSDLLVFSFRVDGHQVVGFASRGLIGEGSGAGVYAFVAEVREDLIDRL